MTRIWITAGMLSLVPWMAAVGCASRPCVRPDRPASTEFSFAGGELKDGKITVRPGFSVEQDPKTKTVMLRQAAGGAGIRIDCACILEAGGACFPVTQDDPHGPSGPILVMCAENNCGGNPEVFCNMEIEQQGGFRFRAAVRSLDRSKR